MKPTQEEIEKELNIRIARVYNDDIFNTEYLYYYININNYEKYNNEKNICLKNNDFDCYEKLYEKYNIKKITLDNLNDMYTINKRNRKINELLNES